MSRPYRAGPRRCSVCGTPVNVWRTYCPTHQREWELKRAAALAALDVQPVVDNQRLSFQRALAWQSGPHGERMILNTYTGHCPPPSGYAISEPGGCYGTVD